jgi:hypothetical protein
MRTAEHWSRILYGALAGIAGAGLMTAIRMSARRRGIIEKTVPQAAEEWLAARIDARSRHPALHHLTDTAMHLGYGAALGGCLGLFVHGRSKSVVTRGAGFGVATWLFGSWLLMPLLGMKAAAWRKSLGENAVDLLAHLGYGLTTAVVAEEMHAQPDRGASSDARRRATRVG